MLEQYFLRPTTVDRIRSNWLAPQIEQYVEWMHAQNYAGHNITRRIAVLCHFASFSRTNGATDLASASSLVERFGDHWIAGNRCWNLETRPKLRRDICCIVRQMLRLILEGRVIRERGRSPFQFQSEAPRFFQHLTEERGLNKLTVARYLRYLNRLADYLRRIEVTSLRDLCPQLLSSFVVETAPQLARNTRRDLCAVIRTFLRFLYRERIIAEDPEMLPEAERVEAIPSKRCSTPMTIFLEREEIDALFKALPRDGAHALRDRALFMVLYNSGARVQEVADLRVGDVDLDGPLRVRLHGKGDKWRSCPLWPETVDLLKQLQTVQSGDKTLPLFTSHHFRPLTRFGIYKLVKRHTRSLDTGALGRKSDGVSPHVFRHSLAVGLLEQGVDVNVIRR